MITKVILVLFGLFFLAALWWFLRRAKSRQDKARTPVGTYGEIKKQIIGELRSDHPENRTLPVRPEGIDTRLPIETIAEHDSISDFDSARAHEMLSAVLGSLYEELRAIGPGCDPVQLSFPRRAVVIADRFEAEVNNGGLSQYYLNVSGDHASIAPGILREIGLDDVAEKLEHANSFFPDGEPPSDRGVRLNMLESVEVRAEKTWSEIEDWFYQSNTAFLPFMIKYIRFNREEFYRTG